jgi:cyanophycinase
MIIKMSLARSRRRGRSALPCARRTFLAALFVLVIVIGSAAPASTRQMTIGPEKGWLVLHGGTKKQEYEALHRFADLAGGPRASVVVIVTPIDLEILTPEFLSQYGQWWRRELGVGSATFMDTRSRDVAGTEAFIAPLRAATGVWITGGHNNTLVDVYVGTLTEREIRAVAERGGVVGGSSAGAMIQGSFLITRSASATGVTSSRNLDQTRLAGFGLLKDITVFPHLAQRRADKMMADIVAHYPNLLGIGIDENTAIVVHDDQFEVIGEGHVGVFEARKGAPKTHLTLSPGQRFDLRTHAAIRSR